MNCLLDAAVYLQQNGIIFGDYRSDRIYLSPEGYIKLYTLELTNEKKHSAYYKALEDKSLIDNLVLSPEQLYFVQKMEF
jgi:serine/threonine protein kinase